MFDYKKFFSIIFALCCMSALNAVIIKIEVWSDGTSYRYLLRDCHVDYADKRNSIQQQQDIIHAMQEKLLDAFLIVEDSGDCTSASITVQKIFQQVLANQIDFKSDSEYPDAPEDIKQSTPLTFLGVLCKNKGIPYYNTECYHSISALDNADKFKEYGDITPDDVVSDLEARSKELSADLVNAVKLNTLRRMAQSFASDKDSFIKLATELRGDLVDQGTIHKLNQCKSIKHVFVCEGSSHIDRVPLMLYLNGYRCVQSFGTDIFDANLHLMTPENEGRFYYEHVVKKALNVRASFVKIFQGQNSLQLLKPIACNYILPVAASVIAAGWVALQYFYK